MKYIATKALRDTVNLFSGLLWSRMTYIGVIQRDVSGNFVATNWSVMALFMFLWKLNKVVCKHTLLCVLCSILNGSTFVCCDNVLFFKFSLMYSLKLKFVQTGKLFLFVLCVAIGHFKYYLISQWTVFVTWNLFVCMRLISSLHATQVCLRN